jgi:CheY-like chemotaxis protein
MGILQLSAWPMSGIHNQIPVGLYLHVKLQLRFCTDFLRASFFQPLLFFHPQDKPFMSEKTTNILLIEDSEVDAWLVQDAIGSGGLPVNISLVLGAEEAMQYMAGHVASIDEPTPDLILLDLHLNGVKGIEVLKFIKSDPELMDIPVVILTVSSRSEDIEETYQFHAAAYLNKPVRVDEIMPVIQNLDLFRPRKRSLI